MEEAWTVYTGVEEFRGREGVRRVRVAPHVTAIPRAAFLCTGLREVDFANVTKIGGHAFYGCRELKSVAIPSTVMEIETAAFDFCPKLAAVTLYEGLKVIGKNAFAGCEKLESVVIPSTVTEIRGKAFYGCTKLGSVTLCDGLKVIGQCAFAGCENLESIVIPSTVTEIGEGAFYHCTKLTAANFPPGVETIGQYAFNQCFELESVVIPSTVTEIGKNAFYHCTKLAAVELPEGLQTIGHGAFDSCSLERITIPSPAFVISAGDAGNTLRCQLSRDATVSPRDVRVVVSKHVGCMSSDRLEEAGRTITEILGGNEEEEGQWQAQVRKLFEYYELLDATTVLELAIWRAKIMDQSRQNARSRSTRKRARVDSSSHRNQCRTDSGAHIILPLVMPFVGPRIW